MSYIVFSSARDLLLALYYALPNGAVFPDTVTEWGSAPELLWAVEEPFLLDIDQLAAEFQFLVNRIENCPNGVRQVPVAGLLGGEWERVDLARGIGRGELPRAIFDATGETPSYLLGAANTDQARGIVSTLARFAGYRDEIHCVVVRDGADSPWPFLWACAGGEPASVAMRLCDRVWWNPIIDSRITIYQQWPFRLKVDENVLLRMNWAVKSGIVLLSRDEPRITLIKTQDYRRLFAPLVDVCKLVPAELRTAEVADPTPQLDFQIALRLGAGDQLRTMQRRLAEMKAANEAEKKLIDLLEKDVALIEEGEIRAPEPVLLYGSDNNNLPDQLRRVLIEWSWQPDELAHLYYGAIEATPDINKALGSHGDMIHILTTAAALRTGGEEAEVSTAGARLRSYYPRSGYGTGFELLREWERYGLRLCVPDGKSLELRPLIRPSKSAAAKLGSALLADVGGAFFGLLTNDARRELVVIRIPLSSLHPLIEETGERLRWRCSVGVQALTPSLMQRRSREIEKAVVMPLRGALTQAVEQRARQMIDDRQQRLRLRLDAAEKRSRQREVEVLRLEERVAGLPGIVRELDDAIEVVTNSLALSGDALKETSDGMGTLRDATFAIGEARSNLNMLTESIATLRREINEAAQLPRQTDRGWFRGRRR